MALNRAVVYEGVWAVGMDAALLEALLGTSVAYPVAALHRDECYGIAAAACKCCH
jgi:hypothetical protein